MARKTIVQLFDDLDGTPGEDITTITFAIDGVDYEIDLSEANATRLRSSLEEFIAAGQRIGGRVKRGGSPRPSGNGAARSKEETKAIREWAQANGYEVAERGRIPASVIEDYEHAQRQPKAPAASSEEPTPKAKRKPATAAFSS
ncbi:Lsr2 family protein [Actinokineospora guangxiensis]|uniref:Lsr2 family protein n=1 Tax=Actinokineospora guangxiensis TaxID=1490288 RepID=A0ABW0F0K7_9PSEU